MRDGSRHTQVPLALRQLNKAFNLDCLEASLFDIVTLAVSLLIVWT